MLPTTKRTNVRSNNSLNLGGIVCLTATVYFIYYLLAQNILPCSVLSAFTWKGHHAKEWHLLAIALVPVYLALLIFGTAISSLYFGSALQRWFIRISKR